MENFHFFTPILTLPWINVTILPVPSQSLPENCPTGHTLSDCKLHYSLFISYSMIQSKEYETRNVNPITVSCVSPNKSFNLSRVSVNSCVKWNYITLHSFLGPTVGKTNFGTACPPIVHPTYHKEIQNQKASLWSTMLYPNSFPSFQMIKLTGLKSLWSKNKRINFYYQM